MAALQPRSSCFRAAKPPCRRSRLNSNVSPREPAIGLARLATARHRRALPSPHRSGDGVCARGTRFGPAVEPRCVRGTSAPPPRRGTAAPNTLFKFRRRFANRARCTPVPCLRSTAGWGLSRRSRRAPRAAESKPNNAVPLCAGTGLPREFRAMSPRHPAACESQTRANPSFKRRRATAASLGVATHQVIVAPRRQGRPPHRAA